MKPAPVDAPNAVQLAVDRVGGPSQASHICEVSYAAIYKWRRAGICPDSRSAVLLSEATGGQITVRQLAGLDPVDGPEGPAAVVSGTTKVKAIGKRKAAIPDEDDRPAAVAWTRRRTYSHSKIQIVLAVEPVTEPVTEPALREAA